MASKPPDWITWKPWKPWKPERAPAAGGVWTFRVLDADGRVVWEETVHNQVVNGALNDLLSVYLGAGTQKTTWFLGLIDASGYSGLAAGDTIASHAGWTEATTYSQATRPAWSPGAVSGQAISNGTAVSFSINGTVTIQGAFLVSNATKSGNTGQLYATALFGSPQALVNGNTLQVTYTGTMAAG